MQSSIHFNLRPLSIYFQKTAAYDCRKSQNQKWYKWAKNVLHQIAIDNKMTKIQCSKRKDTTRIALITVTKIGIGFRLRWKSEMWTILEII